LGVRLIQICFCVLRAALLGCDAVSTLVAVTAHEHA